MTTRRTDSDKVEAYTRALMEAAAAEGRSAHDLQQLRHALKFSPEMLETIANMDNANETHLIEQVYREFKERLDRGDQTISVDVTTAVPMGDELRAKVKEKCERDFARPVYLVEHVEPKILGGIIIEARGSRRDASVRTHLVNIRKTLSSTFVGGDE
ncbi:MAG: F0F1 ATP synthase subunit delta [Acidobacteriota bacterium]|nr:F0F1 ATP synthase subunit delta [Acidobacteriota bacterium]